MIPESLKKILPHILRFQARRDYSKAELTERLLEREFALEDIQAALALAEEKGWQSDQRFLEQTIRRRVIAGMGPLKISMELRPHQLSREMVQKALYVDHMAEFWQEHVQTVWRKKFSALPKSPSEYAKQQRFLLQRGFAPEMVRKVLKGDYHNEVI